MIIVWIKSIHVRDGIHSVGSFLSEDDGIPRVKIFMLYVNNIIIFLKSLEFI